MPTTPAEIRNIALVGQKGAGKTTLAEAMLYSAKATTRLGKVEEGNTVMDFEPEEHKRVASVQAAVASADWKKHKVNIIDTPGLRDFIGDTAAALGVVEGVMVVVSASDGVDPYSARLFRQAKGAARCVVINQMGRDRADLDRVLEQVREMLNPQAVPVTLPIGKEHELSGVIDLLGFRAHIYDAVTQKGPKLEDVPASLRDAANMARETLLEEIAGSDEDLMEKYLDTGELTHQEASRGLKKAVANGDLCPVFVTDAARSIGVMELLDCVVESFPSPEGRVFPTAEGEIGGSASGDFAGVVFKTIMDQHAGKISVFRVVSGEAKKDTNVENVTRGPERLGSLLTLQGKKYSPVDAAVMGDIVGVAKLKDTHTGDTLAASKSTPAIQLPEIPPPQITYRIVPKSKSDEDKIGTAVEKLREEDPTLAVGHDDLTADMTLSGFGVAHIDVSLEKMARKYHVEVERHPPLVAYREYLLKPAREIEGKHKKQSGGRGQFGVAFINMRPLPRGEGFKFVDKIVGGAIPRQYIPAVEKGIEEACAKGVLAGYPVVDFEVELYDGKYHDVDSSEMAFKIAGSKAFKQAAEKCGVGILEPVMNVEVEVPQESLGDIMADVSGRRGRVLGMETVGGISVVKAQIPQAEILTYAPDLKSMTGGRGSFTATFSHYDPVPSHLTQKIVSESPNKPHDEEG